MQQKTVEGSRRQKLTEDSRRQWKTTENIRRRHKKVEEEDKARQRRQGKIGEDKER